MIRFRETFRVSFETEEVYEDVDCRIAYGTLKVEGIVAPALRFCLHREIHDLAVKQYGESVVRVERTSYYICIPPYRYVTYSKTPDILLLFRRPDGYAVMMLCRADAETCKQIRDVLWEVKGIEQAYIIIRNILARRQEDKP